MVVASLGTLAVYWCVQAYIDWQDSPILTTVATTGREVKNIAFPAITICGLGMTNKTSIENAVKKQLEDYLSAQGEGGMIRFSYCSLVITILLLAALAKFNISASLNDLLEQYSYTFFEDVYPGLYLNPVDLVAVMVSEDPDELLRSQVSQGYEYDPCEGVIGNATDYNDKRRKRQAENPCGENDIYASIFDLCYSVNGQMDQASL